MTPDEVAELLIRVDQNVLNLVGTLDKHTVDDKAYQMKTDVTLSTFQNDKSERLGMSKVINFLYIAVVGAMSGLVGMKYGR